MAGIVPACLKALGMRHQKPLGLVIADLQFTDGILSFETARQLLRELPAPRLPPETGNSGPRTGLDTSALNNVLSYVPNRITIAAGYCPNLRYLLRNQFFRARYSLAEPDVVSRGHEESAPGQAWADRELP